MGALCEKGIARLYGLRITLRIDSTQLHLEARRASTYSTDLNIVALWETPPPFPNKRDNHYIKPPSFFPLFVRSAGFFPHDQFR